MLTEEDYEVLGRCILFRGLECRETASILAGAVSDCPAGAFLIHEGDVVDRVWVLLSGAMRSSRFDPGGREVLYQPLRPSYLAGGEVVCTPRKTSPYAVYAAEPCRLWSFPWETLEGERLSTKLCLALTRNLLTFSANQNIRKYYKIDALSVRSARERVLKYLTAQAIRTGRASFSVPLDRESMANYLCLNRSVLSHELKRMEEDGYIRFHKNQFTLLPKCCPPNVLR